MRNPDGRGGPRRGGRRIWPPPRVPDRPPPPPPTTPTTTHPPCAALTARSSGEVNANGTRSSACRTLGPPEADEDRGALAVRRLGRDGSPSGDRATLGRADGVPADACAWRGRSTARGYLESGPKPIRPVGRRGDDRPQEQTLASGRRQPPCRRAPATQTRPLLPVVASKNTTGTRGFFFFFWGAECLLTVRLLPSSCVTRRALAVAGSLDRERLDARPFHVDGEDAAQPPKTRSVPRGERNLQGGQPRHVRRRTVRPCPVHEIDAPPSRRGRCLAVRLSATAGVSPCHAPASSPRRVRVGSQEGVVQRRAHGPAGGAARRRFGSGGRLLPAAQRNSSAARRNEDAEHDGSLRASKDSPACVIRRTAGLTDDGHEESWARSGKRRVRKTRGYSRWCAFRQQRCSHLLR